MHYATKFFKFTRGIKMALTKMERLELMGGNEYLRSLYKSNEDMNAHTENILMLADFFGTEEEYKAVKKIAKVSKMRGYTSHEDDKWMYENIHKKYYKELIK